jgi:hypothetical protein
MDRATDAAINDLGLLVALMRKGHFIDKQELWGRG